LTQKPLPLQSFVFSSLKELADRIWWPIVHGSTDFKHYEREAAAIRWLDAKRFASWLQAHAGKRGKHRRQLAVLVNGDSSGNGSCSNSARGAASANGMHSLTDIDIASQGEGENSTTDNEEKLAAEWMGKQTNIVDAPAWRRDLPRVHGYFLEAAKE
jgi:hypothetical protein